MNKTIKYRLVHQYDQIDLLMKGLPEEFLLERHIPNKWSIHENLAHLGRYQEIFISRLETILSMDSPKFERYRAENDPSFQSWDQLNTSQVFQRIRNARLLITKKLIGLNSKDKRKIGIHPKLGEMNICDWTEFFLLHEAHHFYVIFHLTNENRMFRAQK